MSDLTVEDVLAQAEAVLAESPSSLFDLHTTEGLDHLTYITEAYHGEARWGAYRTIIYAFKIGANTKYLGITFYRTAGDSSECLEPDVCEFVADTVTSVHWRPKESGS